MFIGAIATNRLNEFFTLKQLRQRSPINNKDVTEKLGLKPRRSTTALYLAIA
jgi:hypothetical protein